MSIVERAVDLFGAPAQPQRKTPGAQETAPRQVQDLIERAMGMEGEHAAVAPSVERSHSALRDAPPPARSRTVAVDRKLLREKQIMQPEGDRSPITENFRRIKRHIVANLASRNSASGTNLVMVTSALPGEGKTFCAVNLAISMAMEIDRTVLLVDADVAKPSVTTALGIRSEGERGLMDVLLDPSIPLSDLIVKTDIGSLSVLPAGTRHLRATEVLASKGMQDFLQEVSARYPDRVVIFDSPPLLAASEASAVATRMGQIVVVVEAGRTTEATLKEALSRVEANELVGVLLNKGAPLSAAMGGYGYGYGYGTDVNYDA